MIKRKRGIFTFFPWASNLPSNNYFLPVCSGRGGKRGGKSSRKRVWNWKTPFHSLPTFLNRAMRGIILIVLLHRRVYTHAFLRQYACIQGSLFFPLVSYFIFSYFLRVRRFSCFQGKKKKRNNRNVKICVVWFTIEIRTVVIGWPS